MALRLLPDIEALLVEYLKAHASVTAQVAQRVSTELPRSPTFPLVSLNLVTGSEIVREHLDESVVDVFAWADEKAPANLIIRTVRAALIEAPSAPHPRGVVTSVRTLVVPRWFPDDTTPRPRPRYHASFGVTFHPHPL